MFFKAMHKQKSAGNSLVSVSISMGIILTVLAGYALNKTNIARQKRVAMSRLSFQEVDATFRATIPKQIKKFSLEDMACKDVGSDNVDTGVPQFLRNAAGFSRSGMTFKRLTQSDFDYIDSPNIRQAGIHQVGIDICQNNAITNRMTRDDQGEAIIFHGDTLTFCLKIDYTNEKKFKKGAPVWALVNYKLVDHVTGDELSCPEFIVKREDDGFYNRIGGKIDYAIMWVDSTNNAQRHSGSMISSNDIRTVDSPLPPLPPPLPEKTYRTARWKCPDGLLDDVHPQRITLDRTEYDAWVAGGHKARMLYGVEAEYVIDPPTNTHQCVSGFATNILSDTADGTACYSGDIPPGAIRNLLTNPNGCYCLKCIGKATSCRHYDWTSGDPPTKLADYMYGKPKLPFGNHPSNVNCPTAVE